MFWEIITVIWGTLATICSFIWGILSVIEGILGVIIGSVITIFYGSYTNFNKRIKKHLSLKKDIEQLKPYPPINLIFCPEEMYNDILHLFEGYYYFKKNVDSLNIDVDILILIKDLIFNVEKSFIYFAHVKYPLNYRIEPINLNNGEIELNIEDKDYSGFKIGKLTNYYKKVFLRQCVDINEMIDSELIVAMQKFDEVNAYLNKYEEYNEKNSLISYVSSIINKNLKITSSTSDMKKHFDENPFRKYIQNHGYEMFFMYLNFCPDISFCEVKEGIIFMKTDSSLNLEEVAENVQFYILELKDVLGYQKEKLLTPKVYCWCPDYTLKEYNSAKGSLKIIVTNEPTFDMINTSILED
nr:hypothetical protein [Methanobrevibacter arboriphilus]